MADDTLERVRQVAAETFGCDPKTIGPATVAADVEKWDSLRHLIFISALEQEFGIEFDMDAIGGLTNVGGLLSVIGSLRQ
jgi:acyl carrier protein